MRVILFFNIINLRFRFTTRSSISFRLVFNFSMGSNASIMLQQEDLQNICEQTGWSTVPTIFSRAFLLMKCMRCIGFYGSGAMK